MFKTFFVKGFVLLLLFFKILKSVFHEIAREECGRYPLDVGVLVSGLVLPGCVW